MIQVDQCQLSKMFENIEMESLSGEMREFVSSVEQKRGLSSGEVMTWLHWCQRRSNVKVVSCPVPDTVLPPQFSATLHDVKVGGDKGCHGPDDKIYNNNPDIRDKVARGNTVLEIKNTDTGELVEHDMVVFALKKFTGGMGDEDEDQPDDDLMWQKYFLKPLESVDRVVCMIKENGEAAHVSVR